MLFAHAVVLTVTLLPFLCSASLRSSASLRAFTSSANLALFSVSFCSLTSYSALAAVSASLHARRDKGYMYVLCSYGIPEIVVYIQICQLALQLDCSFLANSLSNPLFILNSCLFFCLQSSYLSLSFGSLSSLPPPLIILLLLTHFLSLSAYFLIVFFLKLLL